MAGEWMKMECDTPEKPEVLALTAALGWTDPDVTVGKLFRLWRWFDKHTIDGNAAGVTLALLDAQVGVTGFCEKMIAVGWLESDASGVRLPKFDRHNGTTAKARSQTAKRVAAHKANAKGNGTGNAPTVTGALPREEKRREEDQEQSARGALPPAGRRRSKITITQWLADLDQVQEDAVPDGDPIFAYAENAGIPDDFLALAWAVFRDAATASKKCQKDWRQTFRNYVQKGYLKLWYFDGEGTCRLTTVGIQAQRQHKDAA